MTLITFPLGVIQSTLTLYINPSLGFITSFLLPISHSYISFENPQLPFLCLLPSFEKPYHFFLNSFFWLSVAPKNSSHPSSQGSCLSHPEGSSRNPKTFAQDSPLYFEGCHQFKISTSSDLDMVRSPFGVLDSIILEVLRACHGTVESKGFAEKVALHSSMLFNGLRLPFGHPIWDILYYLALALSQLYPNAWRILLLCSVVWRMVLGTKGEDYLDLTARFTHGVQHHDGNLCHFNSCSKYRVTCLEPNFSCIQEWFKMFFFLWGRGWEFPIDDNIY